MEKRLKSRKKTKKRRKKRRKKEEKKDEKKKKKKTKKRRKQNKKARRVTFVFKFLQQILVVGKNFNSKHNSSFGPTLDFWTKFRFSHPLFQRVPMFAKKFVFPIFKFFEKLPKNCSFNQNFSYWQKKTVL